MNLSNKSIFFGTVIILLTILIPSIPSFVNSSPGGEEEKEKARIEEKIREITEVFELHATDPSPTDITMLCHALEGLYGLYREKKGVWESDPRIEDIRTKAARIIKDYDFPTSIEVPDSSIFINAVSDSLIIIKKENTYPKITTLITSLYNSSIDIDPNTATESFLRPAATIYLEQNDSTLLDAVLSTTWRFNDDIERKIGSPRSKENIIKALKELSLLPPAKSESKAERKEDAPVCKPDNSSTSPLSGDKSAGQIGAALEAKVLSECKDYKVDYFQRERDATGLVGDQIEEKDISNVLPGTQIFAELGCKEPEGIISFISGTKEEVETFLGDPNIKDTLRDIYVDLEKRDDKIKSKIKSSKVMENAPDKYTHAIYVDLSTDVSHFKSDRDFALLEMANSLEEEEARGAAELPGFMLYVEKNNVDVRNRWLIHVFLARLDEKTEKGKVKSLPTNLPDFTWVEIESLEIKASIIEPNILGQVFKK